ncbi:MAG: hypothetical protein ABIT06_03910 [Saprospiraceae bacterium]
MPITVRLYSERGIVLPLNMTLPNQCLIFHPGKSRNSGWFRQDALGRRDTNGLYSNLFLVGLLNSKLITYLYRLISMEENRTLSQIKPIILQDIPVSLNFNNAIVGQIEELVISIINKIKIQKNYFIDEISKIDVLVYKLYDLTE